MSVFNIYAQDYTSFSAPDTIAAPKDGLRMIITDEGRIQTITTELAALIGMPANADHISDYMDLEMLENGQSIPMTHVETGELYTLWTYDMAGQDGTAYKIVSAEKKKQNDWSFDPEIFDSLTQDHLFVTDFSGVIINGNRQQKNNILDIIASQYRAWFQSNLKDIAPSQKIVLETRSIDQKLIEWSITNHQNRLYFFGRDITDLRQAHQTLEQQKKALSEAEAIGNIGQWKWIIGNSQIEFSDQIYKIFGLHEKDSALTLSSMNSMIYDDDADRVMQVFERAIIEQKDYDVDFRIENKDGGYRYIQCEGRCQLDEDGDAIALYGIMQDVTDIRQREIDMRKAKESVERAYNAKSQFLANMSHELRTPLNAIIGFSEMMEQQLLGPLGNDKYVDYIKGIRESGEHLLDLISDILDMSKIEAGRYDLNLEAFNVAKTIRLAVHMMEGRAIDDNVKINIDLSDEDIKIIADRRAVMQIILNLLSNAIKFSKENGYVNITMTTTDQDVMIAVEDNGIGIPANKLANITMPFEQADCDYTKKYEGTGLGLSITKELAEIHGGSLDIQSTYGVGTKVTITLPRDAHQAKQKA